MKASRNEGLFLPLESIADGIGKGPLLFAKMVFHITLKHRRYYLFNLFVDNTMPIQALQEEVNGTF
jgi:hypothetical protein